MKELLWQKAECRAVGVRGYMWVDKFGLHWRHEIEIMVTWEKMVLAKDIFRGK